MTMTDTNRRSAEDGAMGPRSDNPRRRTFTADYKLATLAEYDAVGEAAARGAILRREGLYSSHIAEWRRARDAGALSGLSRPAPVNKKSPEQLENERLRRENARLSGDLAKTRMALDIMGKAHALLEDLSDRAQQMSAEHNELNSSKNSRR